MKCKDCSNLVIRQLEGETLNYDSENRYMGKDYSPIRFTYCPIVNTTVDIAAEKNCGYFIQKY